MILKRKYFKEYTYLAKIDDKQYYILCLPVTERSILTINSQYMWEIKYGKQDGVRFRTNKKMLVDLNEFQKFKNKIIVFKSKPYKMYKHVNESDIDDISGIEEVFGIKLFDSIM